MEEEYERWRNLIGDFMLEFAKAEVDVLEIFVDFDQVGRYQAACELPFERRSESAKRVVRDRIADPHAQKVILEQLAELIWLASSVRNVVAHNPMQLSLDSILKGREEGEIRSFRDPRRPLTYGALVKYLARLRSSRDALGKALFRARKQLAQAKA